MIMGYQSNKGYNNNGNKGSYNNKGSYSKPAAAPSAPADAAEKPVGGLQLVIPGNRDAGEKDQYIDIGGLWEKTRKSDGKKFFTITGKPGTEFAGKKFIVSFNS
jgi:hypothetical protein